MCKLEPGRKYRKLKQRSLRTGIERDKLVLTEVCTALQYTLPCSGHSYRLS